jgi:hypothetical protein
MKSQLSSFDSTPSPEVISINQRDHAERKARFTSQIQIFSNHELVRQCWT